MAQHLIDPDVIDADVIDPDVPAADMAGWTADAPGGITIDCGTCVMRSTPTCDDCVVTFLCEREPDEAVLLDLAELQALRRLARAGLAPGLRHTPR